MNNKSSNFKARLGLFVTVGFGIFILIIFIIGRQQNLFNPVFKINAAFNNISGLQVGNNVRFSGITVGTVDNINIINDSTVSVELLIKKEIQKFIKTDCEAAIGSEGIIGDRILVLSNGTGNAPVIKDGQHISSMEPVETDAIMSSLQITTDNAAIISEQLAEIMLKVNSGKGTLGRLIQDSTIAENLNQTIVNLKKGTKGLDDNMEAAKHNFLLKGYFNKKRKEEEKKKQQLEEQKKADDKK